VMTFYLKDSGNILANLTNVCVSSLGFLVWFLFRSFNQDSVS